MNLALNTIVLFIFFIIPGLVFRRFYYTGEFSQQYFKSEPFQVFSVAIIPAFIFQCLCILFFNCVCKWNINFETFAALITGEKQELMSAIISAGKEIDKILIYNFNLWVWAALLGFGSKVLVRKLKWDRKYRILRFQNNWHYILRGEIVDFPETIQPSQADAIDFSVIDVLVETDDGTFIYSGILDDYHLNRESSGLEYLYLTYTRRKKYGGKAAKWKNIPGDYFIIPFEKVITLNISYYSMEELLSTIEPGKG